MRKISSFILILVMVSAATAGTWTFKTSFSPSADLKNDGTLIKATNLGNNPAASTAVNGITFDVDWSNTNVDTDSLNNSTTVYYNGTNTEIARLMNQSAQNYVSDWSGPRQFNITVSDLQVGHIYRVQLLTAGVGWHGTDFFVNDWSDYYWFYMNEGDLVLATYTWTATKTSITISNNVNWSTGNGAVDVMGYAVHDIARAYNPAPTHSSFVAANISQLSWSIPDPNVAGTTVYSHVYFGSTNPDDTAYYISAPDSSLPEFGLKKIPTAQHINATAIPMPVSLVENTQYYWVVDCNDMSMADPKVAGELWKFTTVTYSQLAHWKLDGLVGGKYQDSSGQGHDADPNGTPVFLAAPDAVKGNAVVIDPNNGFATAGTWNPSDLTDQFTLSFWIRSFNPIGEQAQGLVTKHNGWAQDTTLWQVIISTYGRLQMVRAGGGAVSSIYMPTDEWVFVALTYKDNIATFYTYVPQEPQETMRFTVNSGSLTFGTQTDAVLNIGCSYIDSVNGAQEVFDGILDEIQVYNYAMDGMEIADLYNEVYAKSFCVKTYAQGFDVSGPDGTSDCVVDIYDFAVFAADWLSSGLYPVLQ